MIIGTIMFDENSSAWGNNRDYNILFIRNQEKYLNSIIRHKGYMYLNQIYEHLFVRWNPKDENPCIIYDERDRIITIEFEVFDNPNNSFLIVIHHYD